MFITYVDAVFTIRGKLLFEKVVRDKMDFYHKLPREGTSASETQVHQALRQLHQGNKGQREGEAGMRLLDQLIGQPETEEQLRKLVILFSEVKRVWCSDGGQSS